ncbi:MAG TPA: FAD:protein FMN transferase [Kineosporiaceae bacterium]
MIAIPTARTGAAVPAPSADPTVPTLRTTFRAMASTVTVQVVGPTGQATAALRRVSRIFARVERACTRFDPDSPLMRANAAGNSWHPVPQECSFALAEAARAHRYTRGLFDPRVLDTLVALGYDRSLPFADGPVHLDDVPAAPRRRTGRAAVGLGRCPTRPAGRCPTGTQPRWATPWRPEIDMAGGRVRIGPAAVDLGGIGKGLAVRWAAHALRAAGTAFLIDAGGDCHLGGSGPEGAGWRVGVEDPAGGDDPVAVLQLRDLACATSSVRLRSWFVGDRAVHHLIDPRTGASAARGLRAVTVVAADAAIAEVWSKALLIAGHAQVAALSRRHDLAALWVDDANRHGCSPVMAPLLLWTRAGADR